MLRPPSDVESLGADLALPGEADEDEEDPIAESDWRESRDFAVVEWAMQWCRNRLNGLVSTFCSSCHWIGPHLAYLGGIKCLAWQSETERRCGVAHPARAEWESSGGSSLSLPYRHGHDEYQLRIVEPR